MATAKMQLIEDNMPPVGQGAYAFSQLGAVPAELRIVRDGIELFKEARNVRDSLLFTPGLECVAVDILEVGVGLCR